MRESQQKISKKRTKQQFVSRHNIYMSRHKIQAEQGTTSQPVNLCRNKDWSELKVEKSFLGRDRKVLCRDKT